MKKFFRLLIAILCFVGLGCSQEEDFLLEQQGNAIEDIINVVILDEFNGESTTVTTEYLKEKWETQINDELGKNVVLSSFEVIETKDTDSGEELYFLKTRSEGGSIETGAFLTKKTSGVYLLNRKICTCEGCPNGCELVIEGSRCRCTDCDEDSNKSCTKTEQVVIDD